MEVFISHTEAEISIADKIARSLRKAGVEATMGAADVFAREDLFQKNLQRIAECDYFIVLLTPQYVSSVPSMQELSAAAINELSRKIRTILPVVSIGVDVPVFLRDRPHIDLDRPDFLAELPKAITRKRRAKTDLAVSPKLKRAQAESSIQKHLSILREHLRSGDLTLVCGAGVSATTRSPSWPDLLHEMLSGLLEKGLADASHSAHASRQLATLYEGAFSTSPLIMAQYLKTGLRGKYLARMREALYRSTSPTSPLIDAIVELCRPQRSRQSLHSIITFNFDDLIERNLKRSQIRHRSVFAEDQRAERPELPIYHVHGFLPRRKGTGSLADQIVFSEDAYHSQFIDAFSWSNLVQLNHFAQRVCLLIGVSMTDPNLRRLLDVSKRKNPTREAAHHWFKKHYDPKDVMSKSGIKGNERNVRDCITIAELLEEQDARNLGLNVIWVDRFDEITRFLQRLASEDEQPQRRAKR